MCRIRRVLLVYFVIGIWAAKTLSGESQSWTLAVRPSIAEDINPDPSIVEIELTAAPIEWDFGTGELVETWAYNGSIPGPTLEAFEDDRVIVHFRNRLPVPSSIYWYGIEAPAAMSGSAVSQIQVEPGEDFRYEFRVPRSATYWYRAALNPSRPHETGLYGAVVVEDPVTDLQLNLPQQRHVLVLDDVRVENGQIGTPLPAAPRERAEILINGREGNHFLVNGLTAAIGTIDFTLPHRMRLINAANARFMNLEFGGAHVWRIGGDAGLLTSPLEILPPTPAGSGTEHHHLIDVSESPNLAQLARNPYPAARLLLTPGERADLIVVPDGASEITLRWHDFQRGLQSAQLAQDGTVTLRHDHSKDGKRRSKTILSLLPLDSPIPIQLTIGRQLSWPTFPSGFRMEYKESLDTEWQAFPGKPTIEGNRFSIPLSDLVFPQAFFRLMKSGLRLQHVGGVNYRPPNGLISVQRIVPDDAKTIRVVYTNLPVETDGNITMSALGETPNNIPFQSLTSEISPTVRSGDFIVWEIHNLTDLDRNFHLHGFPFQWIEIEYIDDELSPNHIIIPAAFTENKDTILIPKRPGNEKRSRTIVRVVSKMDDWRREGMIKGFGLKPTQSRSGGWIYGTSMIDAAAQGMRGILQIR